MSVEELKPTPNKENQKEDKEEEKGGKKLSFKTDNIVELPDPIECVVTNLELKTAKEVFGDRAKDENQQVLMITVENDKLNFARALPVNFYGYKDIPSRTNQAKIIKKYDGLEVGTQLSITEKETGSGYYKVVI